MSHNDHDPARCDGAGPTGEDWQEELKTLRAANTALRESRERLERALEGSEQGFWEWNLATNTFWASERYESMLGFAVGERDLAPENWPNLVHPDDMGKALASIERHIKGEALRHEVEIRCLTKSGEWKWILTCGRIVTRTGDGRPLMMSGTHTDISAKKAREADLIAARREAEQANLSKARFLAAASHDLRQPLSALGIYVNMLGKNASAAEAPLFRNMTNCVANLSELLTDLLDLSKLDAGVVTPNVSTFSIPELLDSVLSAHIPVAAQKGLQLRCRYRSLNSQTDPVLFSRIINNLIANAVRYTEHGGILVGCRKYQGKMWIEVWDSGIGIPPDKTGEIFEEFRQLGSTARNRGSGLGLAIVAKTAALLGLSIRLRSRVGKGSMFAIELPPGGEIRQPETLQPAVRALRVALVEDNPVVLTAMTLFIEQRGHHVIAAETAAPLLERLDGLAPDIVVSDYRLDFGYTGVDVIAAVRQEFGEHLPALLVTGDTDPGLLRNLASEGIVVLHKPVDVDHLHAQMAQLTQCPLA